MKRTKKPTFDEWLAELYEIMRPDLEGMEPSTYCDPDSWRDYYDDGDSPEAAWKSEKSHWNC